MSDRPSGENGRVTITLTSDLEEQVNMSASYVTLEGNNHTIQWYYGDGGYNTAYYSIDSNGYYSESLYRDHYSANTAATGFWGGVMIVNGDYFKAQNVTFKNTFNYTLVEKEKNDIAYDPMGRLEVSNDTDVAKEAYRERANALALHGDHSEYYNCTVLSSQDTMGWNGTLNNYAYFKNCVLGGNADYICGAGTMVFDDCELRLYVQSGAKSLGYITAPKSNPYIFRNCEITTSDSTTNQAYYGRPWDAAAAAYYINCETNGHILAAGWTDMGSNTAANAYFYEYGNTSNGESFESTAGKILTSGSDLLAAVIDDTVISAHLDGWLPDYYELTANPFVYCSESLDSTSGELLVYGALPSEYAEKVSEVGIYFTTASDKTDFTNYNDNAGDTSDVVYGSITFGTDEISYTDENGGYVYGAVINDITAYSGDTIYVYTYITTTGGTKLYSTGTALESYYSTGSED